MLTKKELDIYGFKYLQNQNAEDVHLLCHSLGKILLETDVKIDLTTQALVTSDKELEKIQLFEHKIFKDDLESYPMLSKINGKNKMYYSFWFINPKIKGNKVFLKFKRIVDEMKKIEIRLNKNDVLIIDNDRMFHDRTKISGDKNRHLKRFWIF